MIDHELLNATLAKMQGEIDALKARVAELERITQPCERCHGRGKVNIEDCVGIIYGEQTCYRCSGSGFKRGAKTT